MLQPLLYAQMQIVHKAAATAYSVTDNMHT